MEKHKKTQELIEQMLNHIGKNYPKNYSRDQALGKLQEFYWWSDKSMLDAEAVEKKPDEA